MSTADRHSNKMQAEKKQQDEVMDSANQADDAEDQDLSKDEGLSEEESAGAEGTGQSPSDDPGETEEEFDPHGPEPTPGLGAWLGSLIAGASFAVIGFGLWLLISFNLPWASGFPFLIMVAAGSLALRIRLGRPHPILLTFSLAFAIMGFFYAQGSLAELTFNTELLWREAMDRAWNGSMLLETFRYLAFDSGRFWLAVLLDWVWMLGGFALAFLLPMIPDKYLVKLRDKLPFLKNIEE
jgi:hypothetical protein